MQLQQYHKSYSAIENRTVNRIAGCKVWYVYDGRNAWYSTWVQKYREGCFHLRLGSAKKFCENRRIQGSVFYIEQRPALQIDTNDGTLFVLEINTPEPLRDYSSIAVRSEPPRETRLVEGHKDSYFYKGALFDHLALTFERNSRFWRKQPSGRNSVIMLWLKHYDWIVPCRDENNCLTIEKLPTPDPLDDVKLRGLKSMSVGGNLPLWWTEFESRAKSDYVIEILRRAQDEYKADGFA